MIEKGTKVQAISFGNFHNFVRYCRAYIFLLVIFYAKGTQRNCGEANVVQQFYERIGPSLFSKFNRYLCLLAIGALAKGNVKVEIVHRDVNYPKD